MRTAEMTIEYIDPAELLPAAYNPRSISDGALSRLAALLDAHGFVDPIIARRRDKLIIGGHQRVKANALRHSPAPLVPVVFLDDVSDDRAKALNIALNNTETQGDYDPAGLADLLAEIDASDFSVPEYTGFSAAEITEIVGADDDALAGLSTIPEAYQVVVECTGEDHQRAIYERLTGEGLRCRLLTL